MFGSQEAMKGGITDVPGIRVGHYTDPRPATGCTVVLCEGGAVAGVDVRGAAPGTRETDLLRPGSLVTEVHAVLLSGGSAFGLDAASGVMRYLEERGTGVRFGGATIPIVPAAILFDLALVTDKVRPGPEEGYRACLNASDGPVEEGSVGAGTGATVCKLLGRAQATKGGIGTASISLRDGLVVGAIMAVNAMGGIYDPDTGELVVGHVRQDGTMQDPMEAALSLAFAEQMRTTATSTTIGVVATSARLSKEQANKLASIAHDGLAIAVRPAHLMSDGDTIFTLATGTFTGRYSFDQICAAAVLCVGRAIVRGVRAAKGLGGVPSISERRSNAAV